MKGIGKIKYKGVLVLAGCVLTFFSALLYVMNPAFLEYMTQKIYDIQMQAHHNPEHTGVPVIVDIDEASLAKYGQWPWPRYRVAQLLENIGQAGAASVGIDILFAEEDRTSLDLIQAAIKADFEDALAPGQSVISPDIPPRMLNNDDIFARTLGRGPYVLGFSFDFESRLEKDGVPMIRPVNLSVVSLEGANEVSRYLVEAKGVIPPLERLGKQAVNTGFMNIRPDSDGILRSTPLLIRYQGKIYPAFSLAALLTALGNPSLALKVSSVGIESMKIGNTVVPLDKNGRFFVHYRGGGENGFKTYSASQFLEGKVPLNSLKGKIAILGTSAYGLKDLRATPMDPLFMGARVHATVIDNILKGDFITRPGWIPGLELSLIAVFGLVSALLLVWAGPWVTLACVLASSVLVWQASIYAFRASHIFLSPLFVWIILGANFSVLSLLKFYYAEKDRRFLKQAFSNFVADDIVDEIVKKPGSLKLGGEVKFISVLFCDLANFTNISEKRTPLEIIDIMSRYFEDMTQHVFDFKGTLVEYVGDELMALFGAPVSKKAHAALACRAALAMQVYLKNLRKNPEKYRLPPLSARVGVNSGEVLVGNLGSKFKFKYGALGDHVNLASRLEGLNKIYGSKIIIGQNTAAQVKDEFILRKLGVIRVKGRVTPETVYELVAHRDKQLDADHSRALEYYRIGFDHYLEQAWPEAMVNFEKGGKIRPNDLSFKVMTQRCGMYNRMPRMENFDGVFIERRK